MVHQFLTFLCLHNILVNCLLSYHDKAFQIKNKHKVNIFKHKFISDKSDLQIFNGGVHLILRGDQTSYREYL